MDFKKIEKKWQDKWEKEKVFEANLDKKRKKFFANAPYPYVNGFLHIGHMYTYLRTEAFARYKRMQGFNVLYPQGWHATGSPIVNAAKRIKENEPKQIKLKKDMGIPDKEIKKFSDPEYWVKYFRSATGSPIVNAAKRIKENEPKQIKLKKDMGIPDKEIKKFSDPEYWVKYF